MAFSKTLVKKFVAASVAGFSALSVLAAPVVAQESQIPPEDEPSGEAAENAPGGIFTDEPYEDRVTSSLYPLPGTFECDNNQNVNCGNPVRYTVQDPDRWATYFRPIPEELLEE